MSNARNHIGWTEGDGSGHEGYHVDDYFTPDGRYLGPDAHGIEPIFDPPLSDTTHTPQERDLN